MQFTVLFFLAFSNPFLESKVSKCTVSVLTQSHAVSDSGILTDTEARTETNI